MSCEERRVVLGDTVASMLASDWGEPPVVVMDEARFERKQTRVVETGYRTLARAVEEADDLFLFMEDDVSFNRWIRHNLGRWRPLADRSSGDPFFGTLYNPNTAPAASPGDAANEVVGDPRAFYGTQGIVLSVTTARAILEHWDDVRGLPDIRMSRLAARWSPIWFHRPSLVQHRPVPSMWGGVAHSAVDFSADWRV